MVYELPPYTTRLSARAKHLQLKITAAKGLEVIIPQRLRSSTDLSGFIQSKRQWIAKHYRAIEQHRNQTQEQFPTQLNLRALNQQLTIEYQTVRGKSRLLQRPNNTLVVMTPENSWPQCQRLLLQWLKATAKHALLPQLHYLSQQCQLPYRQVGIRSQTTRWGSCSAAKSIQLNFQLLFLPPECMRYVLIHELCHTKHLNHSLRFWRLVTRFDPLCQQHRKQLRAGEAYIPTWLRVTS